MDDEVRLSERAWRASGSVEDHARHLAALARAGALPFPRLRLAAQLGHEPAKLAAEVLEPSWRPLRSHGHDTLDVRIRLMDVLFEVEPEAAVVTALALIDRTGLTDPAARGLLERTRAWSSRRDAPALAALEKDVRRALAPRNLAHTARSDRELVESLLLLVVGAEAAGRAWDPERPLPFAVLREAMARARGSTPPEHWEVARAALLAWALGAAS